MGGNIDEMELEEEKEIKIKDIEGEKQSEMYILNEKLLWWIKK